MPSEVGRRVVVSGRVQGVGFRASCAHAASRLGVTGQVRNLEDGRVEVLVAGPPGAVGRLVEWCRRGPALARVDSVSVTDADPAASGGGGGFRVVG